MKTDRTAINADRAETIALQILGFLASDIELLGRFLAMTGIGPQELKSRASDPSLLGAVLDFILNHEPTLVRAADQIALSPNEIKQARVHLPGVMPERDLP